MLVRKAIMRQIELKLGVASAYDYRPIMVHLLKSFMQVILNVPAILLAYGLIFL
jgi:hypothetical protein